MWNDSNTNANYLTVPNVMDKAVCISGDSFGQVRSIDKAWIHTNNSVRIDSFTKNNNSGEGEPVIGQIKNIILLNCGFVNSKNNSPMCDAYLIGFDSSAEVQIPLNTALGTRYAVTPGRLKPFNRSIELSQRFSKVVGKYYCSDLVHKLADSLDHPKTPKFKAILESLHWIIDRRAIKDDVFNSIGFKYGIEKDDLGVMVNAQMDKLSPKEVPVSVYKAHSLFNK